MTVLYMQEKIRFQFNLPNWTGLGSHSDSDHGVWDDSEFFYILPREMAARKYSIVLKGRWTIYLLFTINSLSQTSVQLFQYFVDKSKTASKRHGPIRHGRFSRDTSDFIVYS